MRLTRRRLLRAATAGLLAGPALAVAGVGRTLESLGLWQTGNATLSPLAQAEGVVFFNGDRTFGAIAPDRAAPLWEREHALDGAAAFRPRIFGAMALFSGQHWMSAVDRASGETAWTYRARVQTGAPLATDRVVCFGDGHEFVALDPATGAERWRVAGVPDTLASYAPTIASETVLASSGDGVLRALSAHDGAALWTADRSAEWQYLRQLHVHGDILVAGSYKEKLFGVSVHDGAALWSFNAGNFINSHHVADGAAYLWSPTGWIYAIDAETGAVRWRHRTTDYNGGAGNWASVMAELVSHDGRLHVLSMDNVLHVLDVADGDEVASAAVPARIRHAVLPLPGLGFAFPTTKGAVLITAPA